MSEMGELVLVACAVAAVTALCCIADRLCEMEPAVMVQFVPQVESRGDRTATTGSE